jgi:DNA-binding ferritin-like protein
MLFDLRGRRRRAVQATYLTLAVLMGAGLVGFGIGGEVTGGLFDAFSDRSGGGDTGNDALEDRIDRLEKRVAANPDNQAALQELVRDYYQLATLQQESGATAFSDEAKDELRRAGSAWQRYADSVEGQPSASTATYALRIYDVGALNRPKEAQKAAAIVAEEQNDSSSYLQLVAYASLAGDKRTADLATQKAIDLAPQGQKKTVRQQAEQLKQPPQQQAGG